MSSTLKQNKYEIDMCNGTIMDKLISFSLPLMLSGILQLMFNAVDIIVVGKFSGNESLAAVGSTTALINVFTNLFIGISLGANVLAARLYAAGKDKEMSETVHTAIALALVSGIIMAFVGWICAKPALELMDTPGDVIGLSSLYMRIYFLGMPFFMLYNYGAAILRAVGDTKRPLLFLVISGIANTGLNLCFVIVWGFGVAGVAIGTVISQLISCVLVLHCLYMSETSYQLRFSKLTIKGVYVKQIFSVGVPAGIQSTVINFSNVLLQSSVNSFGSVAMAGYTAANNIFGFLYVTVNAVTQACMSFTSQNYGVGKWKRMERVLIDCLILSFAAMMVLGNGAYFFGPQLLHIYEQRRGYKVRNGDSAVYDSHIFPVRIYGLVPGGASWDGTFRSSDAPLDHRNGGNPNRVDILDFPETQIPGGSVHLISGVLDHNPCHADNMLFLREEKAV